jgi:YYY domain-containing protein
LVSRAFPTALAVGVLLGTTLMAVAFSAIYGRPHTRVAASDWIYQNVPAGAKIAWEYWDLPLPLPAGSGRTVGDYKYELVSFDLYNDAPACDRRNPARNTPAFCTPNNEATFTYLAEQLERVEYVTQSSPRLYGSLPRLPWRYPVQQQYFTLLFEERLGFTKVYDGASPPTLGSWTFADGFMDESFTVYDHPRVTIFRKDRQLGRDELRALFAPALERPLAATRYPPARTPLLGGLVDRLPVAGDYAWNRALGDNGLAATLLWLLAVEALGLLALPLALRLFPVFPDRGWGLSKLLGWLLLGYPVWLGASLRLTQFTLPFLLLVLLVGAAFAAAAGYRRRATPRPPWPPAGAGPAILASEAVFLLAGAFFLALRVANPDLWHTYWGGEKPMELAHLNAILRSVNFPPYDPWFAGGTINYYYFGQYLVAVLIKLTGLPVEVAFNLAMPTLSALVAGAAFSVASALAGLALRRRPRTLAPLAFGALGALLFVGVGNLDGLARLVARARLGDSTPLDFGYFWGASRTIDGAITEFPFFTQLWADLHAHAVALPFTILAVGLVVALATTAYEGRTKGDGHRAWGANRASGSPLPAQAPRPSSFVLLLGLLALTLGALAGTNSWDVPTYLLVTGAGLFYAGGPAPSAAAQGRSGGRDDGLAGLPRRLTIALAGTALTGLAAYLLYLPFFRSFAAPFAALARTRVPSPLPNYLDQFGLFIVVTIVTLLAGILARGRRVRGRLALVAPAGIALAALGAFVGLKATTLTAWLATRTGFFADEGARPYVQDGATAALLTALLVLLLTLWILAWGELRLQLPLTLLIAAVGVTLGPELVFVADDLRGGPVVPGGVLWERMNTVFKFYLQGWTLFALGSVGALAWLWDTAPRWSLAPFRSLRGRLDRRANALALRGGVAAALALVLLGSLVYPVVATPLRLAERFPAPPGLGPTLDGYRWMEYGLMPDERGEGISFRDDRAAIAWLNANIAGTPVIAEASIGPYRGNGSRFANATGLPAILGWDRHQYQQRTDARSAAAIGARAKDVCTLYDSGDEREKLAVLQRYHVSYVVVGAVERHWTLTPSNGSPCGVAGELYTSPEGLAALEGLAGRYLTPVFRSGETVIYRVLPDAFSSGVDAGAAAPTTADRAGGDD